MDVPNLLESYIIIRFTDKIYQCKLINDVREYVKIFQCNYVCIIIGARLLRKLTLGIALLYLQTRGKHALKCLKVQNPTDINDMSPGIRGRLKNTIPSHLLMIKVL